MFVDKSLKIGFFLRPMEEGDLSAVCTIENFSFPNPWHRDSFRGEIQNNPFSHPHVVVEEIENKVIGYIVYWQVGDEAQITNIAIHPDYRRKGIGEAVLRQIIDKIKREGGRSISLEVRPSNLAAQNLYHKLGFKFRGVRRNYYTRPEEDAFVFVLFLYQ